jgi:hypothetical protein
LVFWLGVSRALINSIIQRKPKVADRIMPESAGTIVMPTHDSTDSDC